MHTRQQYLDLPKEKLVDYIYRIHKNFWTLHGNYIMNLEKRYGENVAMEFEDLAFGRAAEAYRIGLINKVVPLAELMPSAEEYARAICSAGPLAVRAAKEAIVRGADMTPAEGLLLESKLEDLLAGSQDFEEGVRAFMEGRKPLYKGK